ncbi:MAG: hypothetical protein IPL98_09645 [Saprospiraceae bacterium]|nr:hypothetical protein [Saprospiraceae bacterium]
MNEDEIIKANDLFNYGRRIVVDFETWDKDKLPNPEIYLAENCDYVEQTNMYYTEVVKFILCHEFIHIEKQHIDAVLSRKHSDEEITKLEVEADAKAIDLIKEGMEPGREFISECGIVIGILILFFLNNSTKQYQHPDLEVRLIKAIKDLNISDDHFVWGITCVGLKLWDQQFDLKLEWNEEDDEKQRFDSIIDQIKRRKDIA